MKSSFKIIYKIIKGIWLTIGSFIVLWTIFWFIKMYTIQDLGVVAGVALFASGIYLLFIYLIITILFLIIKWIINKLK